MRPRTIGRLWRDAVAKQRPAPAYLVETDDGWREISWTEAATAVDELANGLLALGIRKGDAFAILAATRLEWALFDFALGAGRRGRGRRLRELVAARLRLRARALGRGRRPRPRTTSSARSSSRAPASSTLLTFADLDDLRARGRAYAAEHPRRSPRRRRRSARTTSSPSSTRPGTTGPPKGCMITHRNYYAMAAIIDALDNFVGEGDIDAALPAARPQLRAADAPRRRRTRATRSRSCPTRCASRRRCRRCGRRCCRASRASTRRSTRAVVGGVRRARPARSAARRLGARVGRRRQRATAAGRPSRAGSRCGTGSPTGSSTRR